ncbi:DUF5069 domain-containing protein [Haloferula sargassicola]|uniref:DUF5069 domain-containing protein n=1 Tax=Haloferula sargassicola TaxID=490096 RepID=A0ABP9UMD1_9BACT
MDPIPHTSIAGCFVKTRGLFYFARMCSKIRLHAEGLLPEEYREMLGQGFDGRTCRYLKVEYDDVIKQVANGKTDEEVLDWCFGHGRSLNDEEVLIYNSFMSKRGWHDDESEAFIPEMIAKYGLPDNGSVLTDFDLIEMDEGRWYPDMWKDAWAQAPEPGVPAQL